MVTLMRVCHIFKMFVSIPIGINSFDFKAIDIQESYAN